VADVVDDAQKFQELHLELALKKAKAASKPLSDGFCIDCGINIPQKRIEFNPSVERCVDCQTIIELKQKQLGAR